MLWKQHKGEHKRREQAIAKLTFEFEENAEKKLAAMREEIEGYYKQQFEQNHIKGKFLDSEEYVRMRNEIHSGYRQRLKEFEAEEEKRIYEEKLARVVNEEYLQEFLEES